MAEHAYTNESVLKFEEKEWWVNTGWCLLNKYINLNLIPTS